MLWKQKNRVLIIIATIFLVVAVVSCCFATYADISEIKNSFSTGGISIGIENYTKSDDKELILNPITKLSSEKNISCIPRITNYAEPCYIRVKILATTANSNKNIDLIKNCIGVGKRWIEKNEYIYYKYPLEENKSLDVCSGFKIPDEWEFKKDNIMTVCVTAEAIQAKNFMPDFSSENPWGDVVVKKSQIGEQSIVNEMEFEEKDSINIIFECDSDGICVNKKSLFNNTKLMPGDKCSDYIDIKNTTSQPVVVLFKSIHEKNDLLERIKISIDNGNKVYKGSLTSKELERYRKIVVIEPFETKSIHFKISLPEGVDNVAQIKKGEVTWCFAIENTNNVETRDSNIIWIFVIICLLSSITIFTICRRYRYEEPL